ncbi:PRTRC system ThiF family protein [Flavobacterium sp. UBA4197]|uniref:PRTRC system ThiF family protein n=1 Tax=Flavobacterium sp. UBA4197 TaxID=1946546 RepID=UPI00257F093F|nr:PRTRC system ThiF family protein [Flavobacterium sp. UBA4197]
MNTDKLKVHFTHKDLINPTNPVSVNVIGAGGTGSKLMTALMEMSHSLIELGHPGLSVRLWDDDIITLANLGRQRFAHSELGLHKSVAIINRINRWSGTRWKAEARKFEIGSLGKLPERASIYISCVDNVKTRFEIADILSKQNNDKAYSNRPLYWLDFGNSQNTGQVILSTIAKITQPDSEEFETVATMPFITDEFGELLKQSEEQDNTPSCSLAEALQKQELYINSTLAQMGCSLLWNLFRNGLTPYKGFFLNLKDFRSTPIPVN